MLAGAQGAFADEVVTLATRAGATQSYLYLPATAPEPELVALLFPGGSGLMRLPRDGAAPHFGSGANFLVRTREAMRDAQVAVALVDAPSDRQGAGMDDAFRSGAEHAADVAAVVQDLKRRHPGARVAFVGTSRGTVSAAHVARALGKEVAAVVLSSTVFLSNRRNPGLGGFDFASIEQPLLFVHHQDDGCSLCPYASARREGAKRALITVRGGKPAQTGPCAPLAPHGYFGMETETVAAIKSWMLGKTYPVLVE